MEAALISCFQRCLTEDALGCSASTGAQREAVFQHSGLVALHSHFLSDYNRFICNAQAGKMRLQNSTATF